MAETLKFDPKTYDWMHSHRWADITVVKCGKCGLHYKPDLVHVCDNSPKLEFSRKIGNIELRACPQSLARLRDDDPNTTINIVMWQKDSKGKPYCFSIAYWKRDKEGYSLYCVGARPFLYVADTAEEMADWAGVKVNTVKSSCSRNNHRGPIKPGTGISSPYRLRRIVIEEESQ